MEKPATEFQCGTDAQRTQWLLSHPDQEKLWDAAEKILYSRLMSGMKPESGPPYQVPVVVHVIHNNGPENISDARVIAAIQHLNEGFGYGGVFTGMGPGTDAQISFCMAKRDPAGMATSGINRIQNSLTNMTMESDDIALKNLSRWDPTQYVNIWVVNSIVSISSGPGVAGYAYFPSSHGGLEDGMVCEAQFFGASPTEDAVLIHEMGHYFGLYHTFQGGCPNADCLADGDKVCDTPPDQAQHTACPYNSCSTDADAGAPNPFSSDVNDMTENFMDYSPFSCYWRFTPGQRDRMHFFLSTTRKSLLESQGCVDPCTQLINAAFTGTPASPVPAGTGVAFTNTSIGATNYSWTIDGVPAGTLTNLNHIFTAVGQSTIALTANNADPNCADTYTLTYQTVCNVNASFTGGNVNILENETVNFINTSTGATGYEWFVNGISQGTTANLTYTFVLQGSYIVLLVAKSPYCETTYSGYVIVSGPCQGNYESFNYQLQGTNYTPNDLAKFPNDDVAVLCRLPNELLVVRLNSDGNVQWSKTITTSNGIFNCIRVNDLGNIYVFAHTTDGFKLIKMNGLGTILWEKQISGLSLNSIINGMTHNMDTDKADGTIVGLEVVDIGEESTFLYKIDGNGALTWTRKLKISTFIGVVQDKKPGSQDFWVCGEHYIPGAHFFDVIKISATGNIIDSRSYQMNNISTGTTFPAFIKSEIDGGFSMNLTDNSSGSGVSGIIRCTPNGDVQFAKKYAYAAGYASTISSFESLNNSGYFLWASIFSTTVKNMLLNLNTDGSVRWSKSSNSSFFIPASRAYGTGTAYLRAGISGNGFQVIKADKLGLNACGLEPNAVTVTDVVIPVTNYPITAPTLSQGLTDFSATTATVQPVKSFVCGTASTPCDEICDNGIDDDEDGFVDCFDVDCHCFNGVDCSVPALPNNFEARPAWKSTGNLVSHRVTPVVANLNPQMDSMPEIIVGVYSDWGNPSNKYYVYRGDGSNKSNPVVINLPKAFSDYTQMMPTIADVDKNGIPELIYTAISGYVVVMTNYSETGTPAMTEWIVSDLPSSRTGYRPYLADLDTDGTPEIYVGTDVFQFDFTNPAAPALRRRINLSGSPDGRMPYAGGFYNVGNPTAADILSVSDCGGDPDCAGMEIIAGPMIYSVDLLTTDGDPVQIKVQKNLNVLTPTHFYGDGYTSVADIDLDGVLDVLVAAETDVDQYAVYTWNKYGLIKIFKYGSSSGSCCGMPTVANIYDDTHDGYAIDMPEIISVSNSKLSCFNLNKANSTPATPYWWSLNTTDQSGFTGVTAFDFNGDDIEEIVYRDESDIRIMYGGPAPFPSGVDTERNWFTKTASSWTNDEYPVVADLDNDGEAEITYTGQESLFVNGETAKLFVIESNTTPWVACRNLWNTYNYFSVNINNDLTVPQEQQAHHLEFPGLGSGNRPFNTYLVQQPIIFDDNFQTSVPVPNVSAMADTAWCSGTNLKFKITVCNSGSHTLKTNTPVTFYSSDPISTNAPIWGTTSYTTADVLVDSCRTFEFTIPMPSGPIWGMVNDDGTLPRPFVFANFPSTDQPECSWPENIFEISFFQQTANLSIGPDKTLCTGSVSVLHAGNGYIKYRWNDGSADSTFTAPGPGTYWVDVWDICGNKQSDTIHILLSPIAPIELGPNQTLCLGDSITLSVTGFPSVKWSPENQITCYDCPSITVKPVQTTTYLVTGNMGNCFISDSIRVNISLPPTLELSTVNGDCSGASASITANPSGGVGAYTYSWSNMEITQQIDDLPIGTYSVTITDENGCKAVKDTVITAGGNLNVDALITPIKCAGETGAIDLSVLTGTPPYNYVWAHGPIDEDLTGLTAGNYTVVITDNGNCKDTLHFTLPLIQPLIISQAASNIPCHATDPTASADISVNGGTGIISYEWSDMSINEDISGVVGGVYTVTATDENGCSKSLEINLTPAIEPVLDSTITHVSCFGKTDGSIQLDLLNTPVGISYAWSNAQITQDISALSPGIYNLEINYASGNCQNTTTFTIQEPLEILASAETDTVACSGSSTGGIDLSVQNGIPPLSFNWSNFDVTEDLTNIPAGNYVVTITDSHFCTETLAATIIENITYQVSALTSPATCNGQATGSIDLSVSSGVSPFSFNWSNGQQTEDVSGLMAGPISVVVEDANHCSQTLNFVIDQPQPLSATANVVQINCHGDQNGAIALTPSGGVGSFIYSWTGGMNTASIAGLSAGNYAVTITDANLCPLVQNFTLTDPLPLTLNNAALTNPLCHGDLTGTINVDVTGGTGILNFEWSNGLLTEDLNGIGAGQYALTAIDANGCVLNANYEITQPDAILITATQVNDSCGLGKGSIQSSVLGGISPYIFQWSNNEATPALNNLHAGNYELLLTDDNGCTATFARTIAQIGAIPLLNPLGETITCQHPTVNIQSGPAQPAVNFTWQTPAGSQLSGAEIQTAFPGLYTVTATDPFGCSAQSSVQIAQDTLHPSLSLNGPEITLPCGDSIANLSALGSNFGLGFANEWMYWAPTGVTSLGSSLQIAADQPGWYIHQIDNLSNGCRTRDSILVIWTPPVAVGEIQVDPISCYHANDGHVALSLIVGGGGNYWFQLDTLPLSTIPDFEAVGPGHHTVQVTDGEGCQWQAEFELDEPDSLAVLLTASDTLIELGNTVNLMATPSDLAVNYPIIQWSPSTFAFVADNLSQTVAPQESTEFSILIANEKGCVAEDRINVRVVNTRLYIPNVIDPGSDGNFGFTVFSGGDVLEINFMRIYDRWGELLFEKEHFEPNNPLLGWDGTARGKKVLPGVYVYFLEITGWDGSKKQYKGDITVLSH